MNTGAEDRRAAKRVSYLCEVTCEGDGINRLNTRINDLSTTGAFIDSMTCFPEGSVLKMKFKVREREINVAAEVRYCIQYQGMGVHFLDLAIDEADLIASMIQGGEARPF